jgi:hypothetical protein
MHRCKRKCALNLAAIQTHNYYTFPLTNQKFYKIFTTLNSVITLHKYGLRNSSPNKLKGKHTNIFRMHTIH